MTYFHSLEWKYRHGDVLRLISFLKHLLLSCPRLKRLVLIVDSKGCQEDLHNYTALADSLVDFAKKKENLIALCLAGFEIDCTTAQHLRQRLADEIVPLRFPFWFHVGPELPNVIDESVPRIHYDEIVNPVDPYLAPPRF